MSSNDGTSTPLINVSADVVTITPELAKEWLAKNTRNRRIKPDNVAARKRDIESGNYQLNGEPIIFDSNDVLVDGQHRLTAIAEAGKSVQSFVIRGVSPESRHTVDTGTKRNWSDIADMDPNRNYNVDSKALAALAVQIWRFNNGMIKNSLSRPNKMPTNAEIDEVIDQNYSLMEWAVRLSIKVKKGIGSPPSAIAFAAWLIGRVDKPSIEKFLTSIASMQTNGEGDPRYTLIRKLESPELKDTRRGAQVPHAWCIIHAWKHYYDGTELKRINLAPREVAQQFIDPVDLYDVTEAGTDDDNDI